MATIFSKIIDGQIPCHKVAESDTCIAFLDIRPLVEGHTLIVPKMEVDRLFDLPDELYQDLFVFAKKVAIGLKKAIPCLRVGVEVIGTEVPHAHIHLIPFVQESQMSFASDRMHFSTMEMEAIAENIRKEIRL